MSYESDDEALFWQEEYKDRIFIKDLPNIETPDCWKKYSRDKDNSFLEYWPVFEHLGNTNVSDTTARQSLNQMEHIEPADFGADHGETRDHYYKRVEILRMFGHDCYQCDFYRYIIQGSVFEANDVLLDFNMQEWTTNLDDPLLFDYKYSHLICNKDERIHRYLLSSGYPALRDINFVYRMYEIPSQLKPTKNCKQNKLEDELRRLKISGTILTGINGWLENMLCLSGEELFLSMVSGVYLLPLSRMNQLPHLQHYKNLDEKKSATPKESLITPQFHAFLSNPSWNCSWEYLYALSLGLLSLLITRRNDLFLQEDHSPHINNISQKLKTRVLINYRDAVLYLKKMTADLIIMDQLYHDDTNNEQFSGPIKKLIKEFTFPEIRNSQQLRIRLASIDSFLNEITRRAPFIFANSQGNSAPEPSHHQEGAVASEHPPEHPNEPFIEEDDEMEVSDTEASSSAAPPTRSRKRKPVRPD